jgi:hypothetical protein
VVEHFLHTEGVTGSNPVPPTITLIIRTSGKRGRSYPN